ncbi:hypothetical protein ABIB42_002260 [Massilia sp. UYP32]|uniref:hypothetical protein n=1 Tax=Massilia sp. UYP32 TaxID=1756386 RepID=UPI003D21D1D0
METAAEHRARLATYAVERGHAHTLRRHLAEGLDPEAKFFYRGVGFTSERLMGEAVWLGSVDCVKALEDAGARLTDEEILRALHPGHNREMVAYLLATGKFDPYGQMTSGRPWADAIDELDQESMSDLVKIISEWERAKLVGALEPPAARSRPSFL